MIRTISLCLLLTAAISAGCGDESPTGNTVIFEDALGRSVTVPDSVSSILSLAPSATETVFAAGAANKLVAVTTADSYPPEIENLQRVAAFPAVDYESILTAQPDVVVASADVNGPEVADRLAEFDIPVFFLGVTTLADIFDNIRKVGALAGTSTAAESQAKLLKQSLNQINDLVTATQTSPRKTLVLVGDRELYSFGAGTYVNEMVRMAGGLSITEDITLAAPVLSDEFVLAESPDVIIIALDKDYDPARLIELHPSWASLDAVANGRIHAIDPDLILRPGPRVIDGVLRMAIAINPELMEQQIESGIISF